MTEPVSDILLERYLAGDLSPAQKTRIESALAEPAVAARLSALRSERDAFYAARSTDAMARAISVRAAEASMRQKMAPRPRWWIWLTPALATAAGVLLVFKMWSTFEPSPMPVVPPASVAPQAAQPSVVPPPAFAQPPSDAPKQPSAPAPMLQERAHGQSAKKGKKSFDGGGGDTELALEADKANSFGESRRYAQPPPNAGASSGAMANAPGAAAPAKPKVMGRLRDEAAEPEESKAEQSRAAEKDAAPPAGHAAAPSRSAPPPAPEPMTPSPSAAADDVSEAPARAAKKSRRPPSGRFTFSRTQVRGGERLGYSADSYSVIISVRDDAPPQILADNSQHAATRGTFALAPASAPRHERLLLFVMSEPFNADALLAAIRQGAAGEATTSIDLTVTP